MGLTYNGTFKQIPGLLHPAPDATGTTVLTPANNMGWVGNGGSAMSVANGLVAIAHTKSYQNNGSTAETDGYVDIFQLDAEGTLVDLADTISESNAAIQGYTALSVNFSPDSNYLLINWNKPGATSTSGLQL